MNFIPLTERFYLRGALVVARELIGKLLVRKIGKLTLTAKIVETEAYIGDHDPAAHSYGRITERNKIIYGIGGVAYVYFIYGNYYCFNVVSGRKGVGNAILIRAVEPVIGIEYMRKFRGKAKNDYELTNGPSKLCMSLKIDKSLNGADLTKRGAVFVSRNTKKEFNEIAVSKRIGINVGTEFPYRFFIKDNAFVTKHRFNKEIVFT